MHIKLDVMITFWQYFCFNGLIIITAVFHRNVERVREEVHESAQKLSGVVKKLLIWFAINWCDVSVYISHNLKEKNYYSILQNVMYFVTLRNLLFCITVSVVCCCFTCFVALRCGHTCLRALLFQNVLDFSVNLVILLNHALYSFL